jgi:predicted deacylase
VNEQAAPRSIGAGVEPRVVEHVDLDELPRCRIARLLVELAHDALGNPVRVPVLVARGERPGPTFGLTASVHGNELNGIPVIHQLFDRLDVRALRGNVVAVVAVNVPGVVNMQRELLEGIDLNDIMPGRPEGNVAQVYAHRFLEQIVRGFDYLIDLHTASFGRANALYVRAEMTNPTTAQMAYLQRPQIILHNPPSDGTLRGAADDMGIPAITVEIGSPQQFQPTYIKRALVGLRAVLSEVGMMPHRKVKLGKKPVLCSSSQWLYTDHGGLLEVFPHVTATVAAGEVVARLGNAFGDVVREYRAPHDGIVIGKSTNPACPTGGRILHLGTVADDDAPFTSRERASESLRRVPPAW